MLHPLPSRFKARAPDVTAEFATSLNVLTLLLLFFEFEPVLYDGVAVVEHGRNGVVALATNSTEGCERARLAGPASSTASIEGNVFGPRRRRRLCYRQTLRAPSAQSVEDWRESPGFRAAVQRLFYSATPEVKSLVAEDIMNFNFIQHIICDTPLYDFYCIVPNQGGAGRA